MDLLKGEGGGKMADTEEQREIDTINNMTQHEMARLWRYAPAGHPYFDKTKPYWEVFNKRFKGFTPQISKSIDGGG